MAKLFSVSHDLSENITENKAESSFCCLVFVKTVVIYFQDFYDDYNYYLK